MTKRLFVLAIILLIQVSVPVHAAGIQRQLQALADQAVSDGLVGVSIAVYQPDSGMTLAVSGLSDKTAGTKITTTDIARIASCSKVWVGAVVMQLVQEGKVALSDKIARYLPQDDVT